MFIMCGRHSLARIDDLCGRFQVIDPTIGFRSHFNIAPGSTNPMIVVLERGPGGLFPAHARLSVRIPGRFPVLNSFCRGCGIVHPPDSSQEEQI
jgi:hypothetical protein